ncbi:MAG: hypothetical protein WBH20_07960 [Oceanisphaera sp.]
MSESVEQTLYSAFKLSSKADSLFNLSAIKIILLRSPAAKAAATKGGDL